MYQCYLHNWFSHESNCPSCVVTKTISSATISEVGEEKSQDELWDEASFFINDQAASWVSPVTVLELKSKYIIKRKP